MNEIAKWIWDDSAPGLHKQAVFFRRRFFMDEPSALSVHISADSRYRLYVNGVFAAIGPEKGDRFRTYYDIVPIGSYLRAGENVLCVEVIHYPNDYTGAVDFHSGPVSSVNGSRAAFWLECPQRPALNTDENWMCRQNTARGFTEAKQSRYAGDMERIDGALLPPGWPSGADQADWRPCREIAPGIPCRLGGVLYEWQLRPRDIPLLCRRPVQPQGCTKYGGSADLRCVLNGETAVIPPHSAAFMDVDMGTLADAYVSLALYSTKAGGTVRLRYAECYAFPRQADGGVEKRVRDDVSGELCGEEDLYLTGSGTQEYAPFDMRVFRYLRVTVTAEETPVEWRGISFQMTGYPLAVTGSCRAEEPRVQQLYDISLTTLERCMLDTYVDCPYYEQMQYTLDTMIEALLTYQVSADDRLARKALYDFHSSLRPDGMITGNAPALFDQVIPIFSIFFVDILYYHYRYHGDVETVHCYLPTVMRILSYFEERIDARDGLLSDTGYWRFVDWLEAWRDNHGSPVSDPDEKLYLYSSMVAYAMGRMVTFCRADGLPDLAARYEQSQKSLIRAVNAVSWDAGAGYYKTHERETAFSQHAQIWAVLSGCVTGAGAKALMRRCMTDKQLLPCSYSVSFYLFRAMEQVGVYDEFPEKWMPWLRLLPYHLTTWPEDTVSQRSDCHGWSAVPLYELVSMAAGLQPASPGADTLRLCPHDVCLGSLTVTVPIGGQLARVQRQVAKTGRDCTATVMLTLERAVPVTVCLPGQEAYTLCQREITVSYRTEMPLLAQIIQEVDP